MLHNLLAKTIARFFCAILIFMIAGCGKKTAKEDVLKDTVLAGLKKTAATLEAANRSIFSQIQENAAKPYMNTTAGPWLRAARSIMEKQEAASAFISRLNKLLSETGNVQLLMRQNAGELYGTLMWFKKHALNAAPELYEQFSQHASVIGTGSDSLQGRQVIRQMFSGGKKKDVAIGLATLRNNMLTVENMLLTYCISNSYVYIRSCMSQIPSMLVGQNTTALRPGEQLEIKAGMASFSTMGFPKVTVKGRQAETGTDGVAVYRQKAPQKPGVYKLPVRIDFIDQDGKNMAIERTIIYTVLKN